VKKVMRWFFCRGGLEWCSRTSQESPLSNEARNQRGCAAFGPPRNVPTKGAKKKVEIARSRAKVASTSQIPSSWERIDSQYPDSQLSPTTSSFPKRKGARLGKTSRSPLPPPTRFPKSTPVPTSIPVLSPIDYISKFIVSFIENVVDVINDGNCGFRVIVEFLGLTEESHIMVHGHLIQELKDHRNDYVGYMWVRIVITTF